MCRDDEETSEEVGWDAVGGCREVWCVTNVGEAAVRGKDYERGERRLEGAVQEGECFKVEHMDLETLAS